MSQIQILHLEDNPADCDLVEHLLAEAGVVCQLTRVQSRAEFSRAIAERPWDVILADFSLPAFDGYSALKISRKLAAHIPFIFLTGVMGEDVAVETLKRGATDYVLKQKLERLVPAITRAIKEAEEKRKLSEMELRLRENEERYRLLIDGMRDHAVYMIDPSGRVISWNSGGTRIFGYTEGEATALTASSFFMQQDRQERRCERLLHQAQQAGRAEEEVWQVRKHGDKFWANFQVTPLHTGKLLRGFTAIVQDITERRRARAQIEESRRERARLQERFLSHISHELRSPIATIVDFSSIISEGLSGEVNEEQKGYLEIILQAANRLAVMVNSLLDLTRSDWQKLPVSQGCVSVKELVTTACTSLTAAAVEKNITLANQVSGVELPLVFADPARIVEVLCNLIDNAIKYTPRGSRIEISASLSPADPEFVQISVSDNGHGIPAEHESHIFDRFYRVTEASGEHPGGLGLGLYISREIVNAHGGELSVTSALGRGSTFQLTLPRFSLARLLMPLISPKNLSRGLVALITVKMPELPNCSAVDFSRYLRTVSDMLRRLVHSSDDLVLPQIHAPGTQERLHIISFTREEGLPIILDRIQDSLSGSVELEPLQGQFAVTGQTLDISGWALEMPEEAARNIADALAQLIGINSTLGANHVGVEAMHIGCGR